MLFNLVLRKTHFVWIIFLAFVMSFAPARAENAVKGPQYVLVMGDSLSAGYQLPSGTGFPFQLEDWLMEQGLNVNVINAGVSGDTSTAGRARLDWALAAIPDGRPDLVIIEFGGNDALRGIEPFRTKENLSAMVERLKRDDIPMLLAGMQAPPNMGKDYEEEFNAIYSAIANEYEIPLYPFFLEGVAAVKELNLPDGIHPTVEGVGVIVENIGPTIITLLNR